MYVSVYVCVCVCTLSCAMQEQGALHYGCDEFRGAELESQDTGGGLAPSHWEIRTHGVSSPAGFNTSL